MGRSIPHRTDFVEAPGWGSTQIPSTQGWPWFCTTGAWSGRTRPVSHIELDLDAVYCKVWTPCTVRLGRLANRQDADRLCKVFGLVADGPYYISRQVGKVCQLFPHPIPRQDTDCQVFVVTLMPWRTVLLHYPFLEFGCEYPAQGIVLVCHARDCARWVRVVR